MYFDLLAERHSHSLLNTASNLPSAEVRIDGFANIMYRQAVHNLRHARIGVHLYLCKMSCCIGGVCIVDILSHGLNGIPDDFRQRYPHGLLHLLKKLTCPVAKKAFAASKGCRCRLPCHFQNVLTALLHRLPQGIYCPAGVTAVIVKAVLCIRLVQLNLLQTDLHNFGRDLLHSHHSSAAVVMDSHMDDQAAVLLDSGGC